MNGGQDQVQREGVDRGGINQTVVVIQVGGQLITSPFPQVLLLPDIGVVGVDDPSYDVGVSGGGGGRAGTESADLRTRGGEKELEFFEGVGFWVGFGERGEGRWFRPRVDAVVKGGGFR